MKRFQFWTDCVGMPGGPHAGLLVDAIRADASDISYSSFIRQVDLTALREMDHPALYRFSCADNWSVSFHKGRLPSGAVSYFFVWSAIEHFFVMEEPNIDQELQILRETRHAH